MTDDRAPSAALACPGVVLAAAAIAMLLGALVGRAPLWRAPAVNMSEAAALRDPATVARLLRDGANTTQRWPVRAGLLFEHAVSLTPLEAAIAARRPEVMEILLDASSPVDPSAWRRARCLAAISPDGGVEGLLDKYRPASQGELDCAGVEPPW